MSYYGSKPEATYCGEYHGIPVKALSDGMGCQVVVGPSDGIIHTVSAPCGSHKLAVELGREIVRTQDRKVMSRWLDLRTHGGYGFFLAMASVSSGQPVW